MHGLVVAEDPNFKAKQNFRRDMFNVIIGSIWQTSLVALPILLVIQETTYIVYDLIVVMKKS